MVVAFEERQETWGRRSDRGLPRQGLAAGSTARSHTPETLTLPYPSPSCNEIFPSP
jgi:hypothetical protein